MRLVIIWKRRIKTMATNSYQEILERAQQELSPEEQQELAQELSARKKPAAPQDGRTLYDALQARGIIGSITDAPPDLSTSPKYMEGFGQDAR
jgi:hypothetical protein